MARHFDNPVVWTHCKNEWHCCQCQVDLNCISARGQDETSSHHWQPPYPTVSLWLIQSMQLSTVLFTWEATGYMQTHKNEYWICMTMNMYETSDDLAEKGVSVMNRSPDFPSPSEWQTWHWESSCHGSVAASQTTSGSVCQRWRHAYVTPVQTISTSQSTCQFTFTHSLTHKHTYTRTLYQSMSPVTQNCIHSKMDTLRSTLSALQLTFDTESHTVNYLQNSHTDSLPSNHCQQAVIYCNRWLMSQQIRNDTSK